MALAPRQIALRLDAALTPPPPLQTAGSLVDARLPITPVLTHICAAAAGVALQARICTQRRADCNLGALRRDSDSLLIEEPPVAWEAGHETRRDLHCHQLLEQQLGRVRDFNHPNLPQVGKTGGKGKGGRGGGRTRGEGAARHARMSDARSNTCDQMPAGVETEHMQDMSTCRTQTVEPLQV